MFKKQPNAVALSAEITRLLSDMKSTTTSSNEYASMAKRLSELHALKVAETPKRVTYDTWAIIAANLVGIVLVLHYEQAQIIPRTALNFVQKLR